MNIKLTLRKLFSFAMLLSMIALVVISCRKKDENDTPDPPGPVHPPAVPVVFTNRPLHMMSDDEIAKNIEFPGHIINRMGNGLISDADPDIDNPFKDIKDILTGISDYKTSKTNYNNVSKALTQINSQISVLQNGIDSLTTALQLEPGKLENYMASEAISGWITNIQESYSDTSSTESLMFFAAEGRKWQAGQLPLNVIRNDSSLAQLFPTGNYPTGGGGPTDARNNIAQLHSLLIPTPGIGAGNALDTYTSEIITLASPLKISDSATMMTVYRLLENYFLQVVNYQFQAVACYTNAAKIYDTATGDYYANLYYTGKFRTDITEEITSFLGNVDRMVINLSDYRDSTRFKNDMQYASLGLAPDLVNINVLARAQFISCLLYDALGMPYPVVSGHMITPGKYDTTGNLNAPSVKITIGGVPMDTVPTQMGSLVPYTCWSGKPAVCEPDTTWNIYRFGTLGKTYNIPPTTSQTVTVSTPPWVSYGTISGSVTPLYYNPQNPNQHSTSSSSTNTFEFAYVSANWQWGYLQLTNSPIAGWFKTTDNLPFSGWFDLTSYNSNIDRSSVKVPSASTSSNSGELTAQKTGVITWTNLYNTPGVMNCGGTTGTTSNYYVIIDGNLTTVKTGANVPHTGGSLQAWAWYKVNYTMKGTGGNDLTVNIGTFRSEQQWPEPGYYIYTIGSDVIRTNWHDQAGSTTWNSGFGKMTSLKTNTQYQPGIQYYYQTANLATAATAGITLYSGYQFVYMGTY
jgi:hypothetical protein